MKRLVTSILVLFTVFTTAQAAEQSLESIRERVEQFIHTLDDRPGTIERVEIHRLDERLRLEACAGRLEADAPNRRAGSRRLVVRVRCHEPSPWKVYVPARVVRSLEVAVTAHALPRGVRIGRDDVVLAARDTARLRGSYYTEREAVIGMQTQRSLQAGSVINARQLGRPELVRRGESLLLEAVGGGLRVSMKGKALENGGRGERIRVRNLSSSKIVEAEIVGRGRARVKF